MEARLENRLSMYNKVDTFFKHHLASLSPQMPALAAQVSDFRNLLQAIEQYCIIAEDKRTGYTVHKNTCRDAVVAMALKISLALYAIATIGADDDLMRKVKITPTGLKVMQDIDKLFWCEQLAETTAQHSVALIGMGVDAALLAAYQAALISYKEAIQEMTQQRSNKSIAYENVRKTAANILAKLKVLDAMMGVLKSSESQLYYQYQSARRIDNN